MRKVDGYNIYIGNFSDAKDKQLLDDCKIKVIMNVCSDIDTPYYPEIQLIKFGLDDPKEGLAERNEVGEASEVFQIAMYLALQRRGNVLIHCAAGNNRSALVAANYLNAIENVPLKKAITMCQVKDRKPWMIDKGFIW